MATTGDDSYRRLLAEWHGRDDYEAEFRRTLDQVVGKVDLSWVTSCIAFGTGSGEDEIEFVRRFLPNLRSFTAVDPDPESVKSLRANFQDGQLSTVKATAMETTIEKWSGTDDPTDAVLLFNVLFHVEPAHRRALFEKLMSRSLRPGGVVVVVENESSEASGFMRLMKRLGNPEYRYKDIEADMLRAGFSLVLTQSIVGHRDLSNPSDDVLKYLQLILPSTVSREEIRTAIADIFSQPKWRSYNKRLAVFKRW